MVHVVLDGAAPEGQVVVWHEGQVVAYVGVHADQDGEELEGEDSEGVGTEEQGRGAGEDADGEQLPGVQVLGDPAVRRVVVVVQGVHVAVQEADLVVDVVPEPVLKVKHGQGCEVVPNKLEQSRCFLRQLSRWYPYPLRYRDGQNVDNVVPKCQAYSLLHKWPGDLFVWLNLVLLNPLPFFTKQIKDSKWYHQEEVKGY